MYWFFNNVSLAESKKRDHIFSMLPMALSSIPFHNNTGSITRYCAADFPMQLAVHEISPVKTAPKEYSLPHLHKDHDEINIIISGQKLVYKLQLEEEEYTVYNNSSIWIPRGKLHAANVLEGSGYFISLRIN